MPATTDPDPNVYRLTGAQWVSGVLLVVGLALAVCTVLLLKNAPQPVITLPLRQDYSSPPPEGEVAVRLFCAPVTAGTGFTADGVGRAETYGFTGDDATASEGNITLNPDEEGRLRPQVDDLDTTLLITTCSRARSARTGHALEVGLLGVVALGSAAALGTRRRPGVH